MSSFWRLMALVEYDQTIEHRITDSGREKPASLDRRKSKGHQKLNTNRMSTIFNAKDDRSLQARTDQRKESEWFITKKANTGTNTRDTTKDSDRAIE